MRKKVLIVVLGALLVLSLGGMTMAKHPEKEVETFSNTVSPQGTAYLIALASASVKDCGDRKVAFTGFTLTIHPVEYISGRLYLQRWNGSKWVNIDSRLFYRFNNSFVHGGKTVSVTPGYYRTHSIHYAEHNDASHSVFTTTNHIYVR